MTILHHPRRFSTILKKGGILAVLSVLAVAGPIQASADTVAFKDTSGHWAGFYITWATEQHLAQGYEDGLFKPNKLVNEAEFLAMLLRTYNLVNESASNGASWSTPYYDYANNLGWPLSTIKPTGELRRGQAALLLASAASGKTYTEQSAIQWLLNEKISSGRTSATVAGFAADGKLTRAEALTFFYNLKLHSSTLSAAKIQNTNDSLGGIALNDTQQRLQQLLGKPSRIDPSEYGFSWYVYNASYDNLMMFGVQNERVTALYSNTGGSWSLKSGIKISQSIENAKKLVSNVTKAEAADDYYAYTTNKVRTTLFLDRQNSSKISAILLMTQESSQAPKAAYSSKLEAAYEQQLFDLANAERASRGIPLLLWDKLAAASAHGHSSDMSARDFFDHTNPDGSTPFDRMKASGVKYHSASENIAAGYTNSFFAHYGWINSKKGHRETLLSSKLKRLGTGVAIGGSYQVYYTQNFYTP